MIKLKIFSESIELQASAVANQYPFIATITYAGKLSDGFVGGTENIEGGPYKVLITAELLRRKIRALAGKSVLVSDGLQSHSQNYKIGKFLQAWVESTTLPNGQMALAAKASGLIEETEDNKEIVEKIIDEARAEQLGFSYDIKDVRFDLKASTDSSSEQYVEVTDFEWRGATILRRDAAAYEETRLAASKTTPKTKDEDDMTPEQLQAALTPLLTPLQNSIDSLKSEVSTIKAEQAKVTPKPEEKKDDSATAAIAAAVAAAVAESNKPVLEAMTKAIEAIGKKEEQPTGVRKTLQFTGAEFRSKYHFGDAELKLDTAEECQRMIDAVHASNLHASKKEQMVGALGSQKRLLQRQEFAAGGAN